MLQLVNLDSDIVHGAKPPDSFGELLHLELVRRASHHMDLHSATRRADQTLDNDGVLVTLVLKKNRMPGIVNAPRDAFPAVTRAPDQVSILSRIERLAFPVRFETLDNFTHFVLVGGDDGVVARF